MDRCLELAKKDPSYTFLSNAGIGYGAPFLDTWKHEYVRGTDKKVTSSMVLCMRKVLMRSVQVLSINGITAAENVTEKVKR